jgi:hypothetical protein
VVALEERGRPWIRLEGRGEATPALTTLAFTASDVGRRVTVGFVDDDPTRPVVTGLLQEGALADGAGTALAKLRVTTEGEKVVVSAEQTLVLKVGKASLTLQPDGTIRLKGVDVSTLAAGQNRIWGASVRIN